MSDNVLVTVNINGNLHTVRDYCNERGFADYLVNTQHNGGQYTVILLRMPAEVRDHWGL